MLRLLGRALEVLEKVYEPSLLQEVTGSFFDFLLDTMASHDPLMPGLCGFKCGDAAAAADPE